MGEILRLVLFIDRGWTRFCPWLSINFWETFF